MNPRVLKRFVIICGISTFVMFTVWMLIKSFRDRPPGDYETQICDQRLKDKLWDQAIEQANIALEKNPNHRGAMMCRALVFINKKEYVDATKELTALIEFLNKTLQDDDLTGKGTLAAAYANRGIIKDRKEQYDEIGSSDNKVIIATYGVASVGINIPRIFNLVLIEPGKSFVRVIQSIGRGIRKAKDKDFVQIWDITSSCKFAKRHLTHRKKFYKEANYPFTIEKLDWS